MDGRGGFHSALPAEPCLASASRVRVIGFSPPYSRPRCSLGTDEGLPALSVQDDSPRGASVDRRTLVLLILARRQTLPPAGVDVRGPVAAFCGRQGPRLLSPTGISHALCSRSGLVRAGPPKALLGVERHRAHCGVGCAG